MAANQFEYKTKDTARLAGIEWHTLAAQETGRDRLKDLGCQTLNGLSVRVLMTLIIFSKALAYFRGNQEVELEDPTADFAVRAEGQAVAGYRCAVL